MRTTQWIRYCATVQCGTRCTPCAWSRIGRSRSSVNRIQTLKKDEDDPIDQEEESSGAASSTAGVFFGCCWAQLIRFCAFFSFSKNRATDRLHPKENLSKRVFTVHVRGRFFCSGVFFLPCPAEVEPSGRPGWVGSSWHSARGVPDFHFSPQLCVGFLFLILYPGSPPASSRLPPVTHHLYHIPSFTHNFVTHHLSHTICHIPSLPHTILSHTIFHTQLCHTPTHET